MDEKTKLSPEQLALFNEPQMAMVTTLMPDGSPQITTVWVDTEGEDVLFNTVHGRMKTNNLIRDPRVAVAVVDPEQPLERFVSIRGWAELMDEGADEHINRLSQKYLGKDFPWFRPGEQRVTVRIHAQQVGGRI
ncbi:MAG: PPOX class F420-dependent oxidoreductase [Candidatus Dormibacteraceae bacterium]